jgi:hypothetical protein
MTAKGAPGEVHDSAQNPLGIEVWFYDTVNNVLKQYIYLAGVASTVATDWVHYDEAGATTRAIANGKGPMAIATAAVVATKYGWYGVKGTFSANVATSDADNSIQYLTATAGRADDAVVSGDLIANAILRSAESGNVAQAQIDHPYTTDTLS